MQGGSDRVANLVLVSCEAFDNYPPGLPGRLLCLNASLPGGTFITSQLLRPRLLRHLPITFGGLSKKRVPNEQFMSWIQPLRHDPRARRDLDKYLRNVPKKTQLLEWAEACAWRPAWALWAFHRSDGFREGALLSVNLGDDADTTGAIYGQLAGAHYGAKTIPAAWRDKLTMAAEITSLADNLHESAAL